MSIEKEIKDLLINDGAAIVGFCELKENSLKEFPELKYAVSIAVKLSDTVLNTITDKPTVMYFHHYRTVNTKLDLLALKLVTFIENSKYLAMPVAASQSLGGYNKYQGLFPHKTAAVLSGIGFIGKSGLLITEQYGSKIRLVTVLTNMPLKSPETLILNGCGDCQICSKACPSGAICGNNYKYDGDRDYIMSAEKCSVYMKEKFQTIGRGSVCGICIKVCPKNKLN
jgi:epoxyqueuosine reductase QueG